MKRRDFAKNLTYSVSALGLGSAVISCKENTPAEPSVDNNTYSISEDLSKEMYAKALAITTKG